MWDFVGLLILLNTIVSLLILNRESWIDFGKEKLEELM